MTAWRVIPAERRMLYSPIGLQLVDDFTGRSPIGNVRALLDRKKASGWEATDIKAVRTPSDVITYPGLGRSANVAVQPPTHCRVRIETEFYRPDYLLADDGIEFDVHPYDDDTPPASVAGLPQTVFLLPGSNYAFADHVRVLRGQVTDATSAPVSNVEVMFGAAEHVSSDQRGSFALPLRWPPLTGAIQIDASDHRTGRTGQISISLPADLAGGQVIVIL
ncbi:carboxypeptidase-like regulatory domain-containing protein [Mesorhizobium muleiense]|uniref:carboxypeptidase-like regulatory domain-containing protein n=1 Tax=Mesorhizobium muleiense TaxID=1004279 RepID=UPI003AFA6D49